MCHCRFLSRAAFFVSQQQRRDFILVIRPGSFGGVRNFSCLHPSRGVPPTRVLQEKVFEIQWGSEYRTSLVFECSKVVRLPNGLLFECHLNTGLNFVWYSEHHLNTAHLNTGQVKVHYSDVRFSDPHCT